MNRTDFEYLGLCKEILADGRLDPNDRTGVGRIRLIGKQLVFDLTDDEFPLLTSAAKSFKMIREELLWFLSGSTDNSYLSDQGINIWTPHVGEDDTIGPLYGAMWRGRDECQPVDQIERLHDMLEKNPTGTWNIVSGWIPEVLPVVGNTYAENVQQGRQAIPPCHTMWQVHCERLDLNERIILATEAGYSASFPEDETKAHDALDSFEIPRYMASLQLYQRSCDMFLGVPFNIASYALLLRLICHSHNFYPNELIWQGGDCHIYQNHVDQMKEQIGRKNLAPASPKLNITGPRRKLYEYTANDIELIDYNPMPAIKGAMAS